MSPRRVIVGAVCVACCAAAALAQPTQEGFVDAAGFETALLEYERNHWPEAFAAMARLADGGHAEAARIALQMWRHGRTLYGQDFAVGAPRLAAWVRLRGCDVGVAARECLVARQTR